MTSRRRALQATAVLAAGTAVGWVWSQHDASRAHEAAVAEVWRGPGNPTERAAILREIVRLATLAPSSHNTQCWKFRLDSDAIVLAPDFTRRCPAVDPDNHHLYVSLGCATENLVHAARGFGLHADPAYDAGADVIRIALSAAPNRRTPLFEAIAARQSTRAEYDGQALPATELAELERAAASSGVDTLLITERERIETVLESVIAGNTAQIRDPAFVAELRAWIRFNGRTAAASGDGLYAGSSGNPALPAWLGKVMFGMVFTADSENARYERQLRSSAGVAVFVAREENKAGWIEVGRAFERFALQATALGIRSAHINQPVEVPSVRAEFAAWLGLSGRRPDLVIRFGHGPTLPHSLRRPLDHVLA
jgi:hypothetical protein